MSKVADAAAAYDRLRRSREGKRGAERRRAQYLVRAGAVERTPMEAAQAAALMTAVDEKRVAAFGVVRLSTLELDGLYPSPQWAAWGDSLTVAALSLIHI